MVYFFRGWGESPDPAAIVGGWHCGRAAGGCVCVCECHRWPSPSLSSTALRVPLARERTRLAELLGGGGDDGPQPSRTIADGHTNKKSG
jgi:hypothetical protein